MLPTGEYSSEDEKDYTEKNVRATYAKAKFACIRSIPRKQLQQVIAPNPTRSRARQVTTRPDQRLINITIDLMHDDEDNGVSDLESDDEDQESINGAPNFGVQGDGIIDITNISFSDQVIQINKQTGQIVPLRNIVRGPIEPWSRGLWRIMVRRMHFTCMKPMISGYSTG
jgi:hypothetical protein